jgi:DnaJ domain
LTSEKDYWEVLGLQPGATKEEIKAAHRRLSLQLHPDKLPPGATPEQRKVITERMAEINEAADALLEGKFERAEAPPERPPSRQEGATHWEAPPRPEEAWRGEPRSHRTLIALGLVAAVAIVVAALFASPYLVQQYYGPAPVWHSFSGVFDASGQLTKEGCSLQNVQHVINGYGSVITATTVVACSYHGSPYTGYYGTDCNLQASGRIPSINGTLVPYNGCVLSTAPLSSIFSTIFTLGGKTNSSIPIYSNRVVIANMTPTDNWSAYRCSLTSDNATRTDGPLICTYLGVRYEAANILQLCNLGTPIQVNGVPVPSGSCNMQRSEVVSR